MCLEGKTVREKSASAYSVQETDRRGVWLLLHWPAPGLGKPPVWIAGSWGLCVG